MSKVFANEREVCGGACHVVERILKCSKLLARINVRAVCVTLRELCVNTARNGVNTAEGACE